jgi:hypothetical protein
MIDRLTALAWTWVGVGIAIAGTLIAGRVYLLSRNVKGNLSALVWTGVGIAGAGAAIAAAAFLYAAKSDTPIEVVDGSIEFYCADAFERVQGTQNQIKASKFLKRVEAIEVWNKTGDTSPYATIDVKKRDWRMTSANRSVTTTNAHGTFSDEVAISSPPNTSITETIVGDLHRLSYNDGSRFTPAELVFTDGQALPCANGAGATCPLTCPTGYCSIRFKYKF